MSAFRNNPTWILPAKDNRGARVKCLEVVYWYGDTAIVSVTPHYPLPFHIRQAQYHKPVLVEPSNPLPYTLPYAIYDPCATITSVMLGYALDNTLQLQQITNIWLLSFLFPLPIFQTISHYPTWLPHSYKLCSCIYVTCISIICWHILIRLYKMSSAC